MKQDGLPMLLRKLFRVIHNFQVSRSKNEYRRDFWLDEPTFRAFPSLSYLHNPIHSPNCFFSLILISGIWCSLQSASTNFVYIGSSQSSANTQKNACRLKSMLTRKNGCQCNTVLYDAFYSKVFQYLWFLQEYFSYEVKRVVTIS